MQLIIISMDYIYGIYFDDKNIKVENIAINLVKRQERRVLCIN
jgi:hypothetical protein